MRVSGAGNLSVSFARGGEAVEPATARVDASRPVDGLVADVTLAAGPRVKVVEVDAKGTYSPPGEE